MTTVGQMLAAGLLASAMMSFLVIVPSQTRFHLLTLCVIASAGAAATAVFVYSGRQTENSATFGSMMTAFDFIWLTVIGPFAYVVGRSFSAECTRAGERIVLSFGVPIHLLATVHVVGSILSSLQVS